MAGERLDKSVRQSAFENAIGRQKRSRATLTVKLPDPQCLGVCFAVANPRGRRTARKFARCAPTVESAEAKAAELCTHSLPRHAADVPRALRCCLQVTGRGKQKTKEPQNKQPRTAGRLAAFLFRRPPSPQPLPQVPFLQGTQGRRQVLSCSKAAFAS